MRNSTAVIYMCYHIAKTPDRLRDCFSVLQRKVVLVALVSSVTFALLAGPGYCAEGPVPVEVESAKLIPIVDELPLSASLIPRRSSSLSARVDGIVSEIRVQEGQYVAQGEVVAILDRTLAELNLKRANASLEEITAQLTEARRQRDETANLVEKRHVSATSYKALIAEVAVQTAILKQRQVELKLQQEIVRRHSIRAPFPGVVATKQVEIGEWVEQGDAVLELVELDFVRLRVDVPQQFFNKLSLQTPVIVRFDAIPGSEINALVQKIIPVGNSSARSFPIHIDLENRQRQIAPGMSARVILLLAGDGDEKAISVPRDAVVKTPGGLEIVWKIVANGESRIVEPITVKTGLDYHGQVRLLGGLIHTGDSVVVRGNEILEAGQPVDLVGD